MELLIVRHAAVAYVAKDGAPQDTVAVNPPLTLLGERQADAVASRLRATGITAVYASPAIRCLQTAQALTAAAGVPGHAVPWLGEAGRLWEDWARLPRPAGTLFDRIQPGSPPTEAEWGLAREETGERPTERPAASLLARSRKVLATVWEAHPRETDDRVCLVTHSGLGGYGLLPALFAAPSADNPRFVLDHASVTMVRCDGRGNLALRINCTRHLAGLTVVLCADAACGHQSPDVDDRWCRRCGGATLLRCPTCSTDILAPAGAHCSYCRHAYHGPSAVRAQ